MSFHPEIISWLQDHHHGSITNSNPVGGGCIHNARLIQTDTGFRFFLKQNTQTASEICEKEARGLKALAIPGGPVLPEVYLVGTSYLMLEDLQPELRRKDFWELYGDQLAQVHKQVNDLFGFQENNYIGSNPQINTWMENGHEFFRENRLIPQIINAQERNLLTSQDLRNLDILIAKLPELIPEQPPSLIHGDLWNGNLITDHRGMPAIIDPAVYYGWAEADLAMTDLFGSYPIEFYKTYSEVRSLNPGYRDRYKIYNLYHLINHLNLFGKGYLPQIRTILARYT
ncbi:MAG: fructosamine kinase family protein [Anaerolineales bacterium]|nr:fructosamine kinase family protein [Anaerolineales bacterium]